MVITSIGQVGITTASKRFILTPSLAAIASLTDPVDLYLDLASTDTPHQYRVELAHQVLMACCPDKSLAQHLGMQPVGKPRMRGGVISRSYRSDYVDDVHAVCIAESLLFHGMVGKVEHATPPSGDAYSSSFDPLQWVASGMAHLGLSEKDVWGMTMTSLLNALKVKYPPSEKEQQRAAYTPEAKAEHDAWYESIYGPKVI